MNEEVKDEKDFFQENDNFLSFSDEIGEPPNMEDQGFVVKPDGSIDSYEDIVERAEQITKFSKIIKEIDNNADYVEMPEMEKTPENAKKFHDALANARKNNKKGLYVSLLTEEEYNNENIRLFLSKDGFAGFALQGEDIISVFSDKNASKRSKSVYSLLLNALHAGGRKLDCFGIELVKTYERMGFKPTGKIPFDLDLMTEEWKKNLDVLGTPDIYALYWNDRTVEKTLSELKDRFKTINDALIRSEDDRLKEFLDYDDLLKNRDQMLDAFKPAVPQEFKEESLEQAVPQEFKEEFLDEESAVQFLDEESAVPQTPEKPKIQEAERFISPESWSREKSVSYSELDPLISESDGLIGSSTVVYNLKTNTITIRPNTSVEDLQKIASKIEPGAQLVLRKDYNTWTYELQNGLSHNGNREKIQISPALLNVLGNKVESMTIDEGVDIEYLNSGNGDIWRYLPNLKHLQMNNNKGVPCNIDGTGAFKEHPNLSCVSMCLEDNGFLSEGFCQGTPLASFMVYEKIPGEAHGLEMENNVLFGSSKNSIDGLSRNEWNAIHDTVLKCNRNDNPQNKTKNEEYVKKTYDAQINNYDTFINSFDSKVREFYNKNIKNVLDETKDFTISDELNRRIGLLGQIGNPPKEVMKALGDLQKEISKSSLASQEKKEIYKNLKQMADLQGQAFDAIKNRDGLIAQKDNLNLSDKTYLQIPSRLKTGNNCLSCRQYDYVSSTDPNGKNYNKAVEKQRQDFARNTITAFYSQAIMYDNSSVLMQSFANKTLYNFLVDFNNAQFERTQGKRKGEKVGRLNYFGTKPNDYETKEANGLTLSSSLQETYDKLINEANEIFKNDKSNDYIDVLALCVNKKFGEKEIFNKYLNEIYTLNNGENWKNKFSDSVIEQYANKLRLKYRLSDNTSRNVFYNKEFSKKCAGELLKLVHDFNKKIPNLETRAEIDTEVKKINDRISDFVNIKFFDESHDLTKEERTDFMNIARSEFREIFKSLALDESGKIIDFEQYKELENNKNVLLVNPGSMFGNDCLCATNLNGIVVNENSEAYKHFIAHAKDDLVKAEQNVFTALFVPFLDSSVYMKNPPENLTEENQKEWVSDFELGIFDIKDKLNRYKDLTQDEKDELSKNIKKYLGQSNIGASPVGEYKKLIEGHIHNLESGGKEPGWDLQMAKWKAAQKAYEEYCNIRNIVEKSGTKENWLALQSFASEMAIKNLEEFEKTNSTRKTKINGVDLYEMDPNALSPENKQKYQKLLEEKAAVSKDFNKVKAGNHLLSEGNRGGAEKTMLVGEGVDAGVESFSGNPTTIELHNGIPETAVTTDVIRKNMYRDSNIFRGRLMCLAERIADAFDSRHFRFVRLEEAVLETLLNLLKILFHVGRSCYEFGAKQYRNLSVDYFERSAKEARELLLMMGKDGVNVVERLCSPSVPDSEYNALAKMVGSYQLNNILNSKTSSMEKNQALVQTLSERCAILEKKRDDIEEAIKSSQLTSVQKEQCYEMLGKYNFMDGIVVIKKLKEQVRKTMSEKPRKQEAAKVKIAVNKNA